MLGGWQLNGIATFAAGPPVTLSYPLAATSGANVPNNLGRSAEETGRVQDRLAEYFDRSAFGAVGNFSFGNSARRLPDVRADEIQNFDVSLFKTFQIVERIKLQFRSEFFNMLNTPRGADLLTRSLSENSRTSWERIEQNQYIMFYAEGVPRLQPGPGSAAATELA